ncbi:unnamed protein product [Spirodela intermedia]|uniref:Transcription factor CBF/NF-Y/archaeal histone domain-containing protein n=1 Tax=Spirodela intermedia TaxID=51605 RepID=A0A7I8IXJ2_SPIIN|nr:unnamed protein product [Spirodela intermedia]CAA6662577.1 unnamed protein product [Spirodela intermedia]
MPRGPASEVILVSSSSSSEGGGEAHAGKVSGGGGGGGSDRQHAASADEVGSSRGGDADRVKERMKKRTKNGEGSDAAAARGESRRGGDGRKTKKKKKKKKGEEEEEKKSSSPLSYTGDFVATSDGISLSSPSWSFPMSRVRRLIAGSESAGGNSSNLRTTLDSVFVINQAAKLFLEEIAEDAHAQATRERKKSVYYKHLSTTVGHEKRYEFLSDFVPEKVRPKEPEGAGRED